MNIHSYIEKLRALPDKQKKIILWIIIAVLVLVMGYFWIKSVVDKLDKLGEGANQIQLPETYKIKNGY